MHLAIGLVLNQVFGFQQPPEYRRRVTLVLLGILVPFFIYHCVADEFVLHVVLFFGMSVVVTRKTQQIIKLRMKDPVHRKKMANLATFGTGSYSVLHSRPSL
jgi:dihydroceramidase